MDTCDVHGCRDGVCYCPVLQDCWDDCHADDEQPTDSLAL